MVAPLRLGLGDINVPPAASQLGIDSYAKSVASNYGQQFGAAAQQYAGQLSNQLGIDPSAIASAIPPATQQALGQIAVDLQSGNDAQRTQAYAIFTNLVLSIIGSPILSVAWAYVMSAFGTASGAGPDCCAKNNCDPTTLTWAYTFSRSPMDPGPTPPQGSFEEFAYACIEKAWEAVHGCNVPNDGTVVFANSGQINPAYLATAIQVWNSNHSTATQRWVSRVVNGGVSGGFSSGVPQYSDPISESIQNALWLADATVNATNGTSGTHFPAPVTVGFWINDGPYQLAGQTSGNGFSTSGGAGGNTGAFGFQPGATGLIVTPSPSSPAKTAAVAGVGVVAAAGAAAFVQSQVTGVAVSVVLENAWRGVVGVFQNVSSSFERADEWAAEERAGQPSRRKFERCVRKVKKSSSAKNPWAICNAALRGKRK